MEVEFFCRTNAIGSKKSTVIEFPDDVSEEVLKDTAERFFWQTKEPEWWYEIKGEDE